MAWTTPKTDWQATYDENGEYLGDFLNVADYERICGNLQHIKDLYIEYNKPNVTLDAMVSIDTSSLAYASQWNAIENNLEKLIIAFGGLLSLAGNKKIYIANGRTIDYNELNRIESISLQVYEYLPLEYNAERHLEFSLGLDNIGAFSTIAGGSL